MIPGLIDEAIRVGIDPYDHVATSLCVTRQRAKNICFVHLYGGNTPGKLSACATARIVDKIYAQYPFFSKWRDKVERKYNWTPAPREQAQDRMNRVQRYIIKVTNDGSPEYRLYSVISTNETDARVIAFAMDGGFSPQTDSYMEVGHVQLALTWTEVMV